MGLTRRDVCRLGGALAVGVPAALTRAAAVQGQGGLVPGMVVALQGTPHLFIADEAGVLHWAGDTRALADRPVNWGQRIEVGLDELQALPRGDPWLSAGLLKDGEPIYLVKWETEWPQPKLLHIQSIEDVELFGINGENYGRFVLDRPDWEQKYGMSAAGLERQRLAPAVPPPLYRANWSLGLSGWNGGPEWKAVNGMLVNTGKGQASAISAPYRVPVPDYAVEASLQLVSKPEFWDRAGIFLRGTALAPDRTGVYLAGIRTVGDRLVAGIWYYELYVNGVWTSELRSVERPITAPLGTWHVYRFEAKGNRLRLYFDGGLLVEALDNRLSSGSEVGLFSSSTQISVRSFRVLRV
jgi:hypothetical protein